jgi:leucyl-tRNA synthetase
MMEFSNLLGKAKRSSLYNTALWHEALEKFNLILAPYAPHLAEELWKTAGHPNSVHLESFPVFDESKIVKDVFELVIQVNGKLRGKVEAPFGISQEAAIALAKTVPAIHVLIADKPITKEIYVSGKLVNIVAATVNILSTGELS